MFGLVWFDSSFIGFNCF